MMTAAPLVWSNLNPGGAVRWSEPSVHLAGVTAGPQVGKSTQVGHEGKTCESRYQKEEKRRNMRVRD